MLITPNLVLSHNFPLRDAMRSSTADRFGIDNTPPAILIPALRYTAENIAQPCRDYWALPITPNSWFRCEQLEKQICWAGRLDSSFGRWCKKRQLSVNEKNWKKYFAKKQHPKGNALDFEIPGISNLSLARWIDRHLDYDQLILEFHDPADPRSGWVHCSTNPDGNRRQAFRIMKGGRIRQGIDD
ncbi:peptidase M15A [Candidatus Kaiserbacteria bacterium]|nr:MAG: peptidase M15A [Candidatus Kaiserbacteria bacterium]